MFSYLRNNPADAVAAAVTEVLSTPLMTSLARTVYSDTTVSPVALLDTRFANPRALRAHLLEAFIPAAYSHHVDTTGSGSLAVQVRYTPDQALGWLRFLARHMERLSTRDLAWWQLTTAIPNRTRGILAGLVCGLAMGVVGVAITAPALDA